MLDPERDLAGAAAVKRMKRVRYPDDPPFGVSKGCI